MNRAKLFYQGANTLILKKESSTLLIDPYFSRVAMGRLLSKIKPNPQRVSDGLRSVDIDTLDGILLTHTHYDHALDATEVVRQQGGTIFGSESAANLAKGAGLRADQYHTVSVGDPFEVGSFRIVFHLSKHISFPPPVKWLLPEKGSIQQPLVMPAWFWNYQCGMVFAVQVDRLLVFGSAGYIPGAYQDLDIETVVLGIGGLEIKPFSYLDQLYREVVLASGARQVLISHWDNFFQPGNQDFQFLGLGKQTYQRIKALGKRYGQSVRLLTPGEQIFSESV